MSTILAKGNTRRPGQQAIGGRGNYTLGGVHFLKIVYDEPNELPNLFCRSQVLEIKMRHFYLCAMQEQR